MQDLVNIFVFLLCIIEFVFVLDNVGNLIIENGVVVMEIQVQFLLMLLIFVMLVMLFLYVIIFCVCGGEIQKIVLFKINMIDVCVVMFVDFIYGFILFYFKEFNDVLMFMIWVFLGMLVGCEIVIVYIGGLCGKLEVFWDVVSDIFCVFIGLVISVVLVIFLLVIVQGQFGVVLFDFLGYLLGIFGLG